MNNEGPVLEALTRRLAETPPDFLADARIGRKGTVIVPAVVNDLLVALGHAPLAANSARDLQPTDAKQDRNRLQVILIACWLLYDEWFREHPEDTGRAFVFLSKDLRTLSEVTNASRFVNDPDRREELVRVTLNAFGLRPQGETVAQAQDRMTTLNSVERERVIRAARAAEERAREVREALEKAEAEEAAAKAFRE